MKKEKGKLGRFCVDKDNNKKCNKVQDGKCIAYENPEVWQKYGGCPLNTIPEELRLEQYKEKKEKERAIYVRKRK